MALRLPTNKDLQELARADHFELNEDEIEGFQQLMAGMFQSYEQLHQMPEPHEPIKYSDRDPGQRPSRREDPFNAILRRCTLRGAPSGKLAGKRIGLKNNVCVAGMPMTCGSLVLQDYLADTDATIVTRLLDAGAEIAALLNLENFAFSAAGDTSAFGPILNPHNPQHLAGGSSGGSAAALYYDDIDITIGGDQGGSIRIPASWCGVVGHKPTHGLVPYTGIVGVDATIDHAGPMTRTVADAAATLEVIAGKDPLDPRQGDVPVQPYTEVLGQGVQGLRIGVLTEGFGLPASETDVDESVRKALAMFGELGADITEVSVPDHSDARAIGIAIREGATAYIQSNGMGYGWQGQYNPSLTESLGKARRAQADDFPATMKLTLMLGTYMKEHYHGRLYAKAQNLRRGLRSSYDRALEQVDVLAMPTTPMKAHKNQPGLSQLQAMISHGMDISANTAPFDWSGHPAISIPCGKSDGLPVGLMLVGRHFDDATLFQAAHAFEQHVDWETL